MMKFQEYLLLILLLITEIFTGVLDFNLLYT